MNATCGDDVRIVCEVEPPDQQGVEWELQRNGASNRMTICSDSEVHVEGKKYECMKRQGTHILVINNVWLNDSGKYTCTEDVGRGPGSKSSRLTVSGE